jgi:hypothetical protein
MKTYDFVEDYLEVLAGKRDLAGKISSGYLFGAFSPIVSLARYDTSFLDDLTGSTLAGTSMTDRQAQLAVKIILKYQRQLASKGIDVTPCTNPKYRKSLRYLDRSKRIWSDGSNIYLRFPYDSNMITQLRELLKARQGSAHFDKENKVWVIAVSEYNINFTVSWAKGHNFEVDQPIEQYLEEIITVEQQPYKIQLCRTESGLELTNASPSMLDYIHAQGLSLDDEHLHQLVDLSSVLGYTVHEDLVTELDSALGPDLVVFMLRREYELAGAQNQLSRLLRYAQLVNRLPMIIYAPSLSNEHELVTQELGQDQVTLLLNKKLDSIKEITTPVLFTHKPINTNDTIPLLISYSGMLPGIEKQMMQQNSEKIVYLNHKLGK